jgi:hypothetical protein
MERGWGEVTKLMDREVTPFTQKRRCPFVIREAAFLFWKMRTVTNTVRQKGTKKKWNNLRKRCHKERRFLSISSDERLY